MTTGPTQPRKSQFRWLTLLVLLVIAALAGLGLISLRQDRRAAEQDARILAEALADSLARESAAVVAEAIQHFAGQVDDSRNALLRLAYGDTNDPPPTPLLPLATLNTLPRGRYFIRDPERFPPPHLHGAPEPPDWVLSAPRETLAELETAERYLREGNRTAAENQLRALAQSDFRPLQALARLRLAELAEDPATEAAAQLRSVAGKFADDLTAAGLAVGDLALLRAIRLAPTGMLDGMFPEIISRATFRPSFLSERFFAGLEQRAKTDGAELRERVSAAITVWNLERGTRRIVDAWSEEHGIRPGVFHTKTDQGTYYLLSSHSSYVETNAVISPTSATTNVVHGADFVLTIVPESVVDAALRRAAANLASRWPRYLAAEFEMAGRRFGATPWALGTTHRWDQRSLLASRSERLSPAKIVGPYPFTLSVWLADPDLLYAKQRQRLLLFGTLIVLAAGVALFGAWQLQKNLHAQLQLNEQKSNFVSSVSHELRAPIASVRLMAESLERGKIAGSEKQHEYFRFIGQECRRLSSLIENVLDFSRIEQGRKQYEFEPTDLGALVEQTVKLMSPYAAEKGVKLELGTSNIQHPTSNIELCMDGRALQQALVNLIDNAIKHSPKDSTVTVGLEWAQRRTGVAPVSNFNPTGQPEPAAKLETAATAVLLSVSDHGPGIPASEHAKIFERFHRLGSELRRETQGVGIGLSIVQHIVEAHGGRVHVESEPGEGSRFTIELPMK